MKYECSSWVGGSGGGARGTRRCRIGMRKNREQVLQLALKCSLKKALTIACWRPSVESSHSVMPYLVHTAVVDCCVMVGHSSMEEERDRQREEETTQSYSRTKTLVNTHEALIFIVRSHWSVNLFLVSKQYM